MKMSLRLENLFKKFDRKTVINGLSMSIEKGEFHVLLGPSGDGKSVLLGLIAGLLKADAGRILINEKDLTRLLPEKRPVSMVFQDYALFPHLTVRENIAFGMKTRRKPRTYIKKKVDEYLELVNLKDKGDEKPHTLSGGQKQRTAIARALAAEPEIILFDEALSHLDLALKEQLMGDLKEMHRQTGTTILYVTHNRNEAVELADRVTLINGGTVEQSGTVEELFCRPATEFAASFVGRNKLKKEIWIYTQNGKSILQDQSEIENFEKRRMSCEKIV
jgi:ABC-type Fe3+/spermidine/putrescine transport system ATPase subunit